MEDKQREIENLRRQLKQQKSENGLKKELNAAQVATALEHEIAQLKGKQNDTTALEAAAAEHRADAAAQRQAVKACRQTQKLRNQLRDRGGRIAKLEETIVAKSTEVSRLEALNQRLKSAASSAKASAKTKQQQAEQAALQQVRQRGKSKSEQ